MSDYPRDLTAAEISPRLAGLVRDLAERLLSGPAPTHEGLRAQLKAARIDRVTLTGAGLYAYFEHPSTTVRVSPSEIIGGEVPMKLVELDAPAGSLISVSGGLLEFVEVYTFGDKPWPDEPGHVAFGEVTPLPIHERAI